MKSDCISRKIREKNSTNKVIDMLTYFILAKKHKQRIVRKMRQELQTKTIPPVKPTPPEPNTLKFGSFNINGPRIEAGWESFLSRNALSSVWNELNNKLK